MKTTKKLIDSFEFTLNAFLDINKEDSKALKEAFCMLREELEESTEKKALDLIKYIVEQAGRRQDSIELVSSTIGELVANDPLKQNVLGATILDEAKNIYRNK